jgi:hypothetical protein
MIFKQMKKIVLVLMFLAARDIAAAQKINGQWRGFFDDNGGNIGLYGGSTEYVLELEINDTKVTGSSYTYFENRRYYVICNLNGSYDKKSKKIIVNETDRVKGSTPASWSDCLQTHILYYQKEEGKEVLKGDWKTSPYQVKQNGGCGVGSTTLSRRILTNMPLAFNKKIRTTVTPKTVAKATPSFKDKNKPPANKPVAKNTTIKKTNPLVNKENIAILKKTVIKPEEPETTATKIPEAKINTVKAFEKRSNNVIKTIEIVNETFKVDLYDNGDIDGDSVSLFLNGKLLLSHKRLSDKAITLNLNAEKDKGENELIMYADNLGTIPPNTALMVVTDGSTRYEVRISSDLQKSGTIRFIHKPKITQ